MIGHYAYGQATCAALFDRNASVLYTCRRVGKKWHMFANGKRVNRPKAPTLNRAIIGTNYGYDNAPLRNLPLVMRLVGKIATVRLMGCGGIDMTLLATGALHGYIGAGFSPFDLGTDLIFLEAAGMRTEKLEGGPVTIWDSDFITAPPKLFPKFKRLLVD